MPGKFFSQIIVLFLHLFLLHEKLFQSFPKCHTQPIYICWTKRLKSWLHASWVDVKKAKLYWKSLRRKLLILLQNFIQVFSSWDISGNYLTAYGSRTGSFQGCNQWNRFPPSLDHCKINRGWCNLRNAVQSCPSHKKQAYK